MSRDIRSFFMPTGKKTEKEVGIVTNQTKKSGKRPRIIIDSDSDEEKKPSPKQRKSTQNAKKTTRPNENLKQVSAADVLGSGKIKRSAPKTSPLQVKSSRVKEIIIHSDDEFEATLNQLDKLEAEAYQDTHSVNDNKVHCNDEKDHAEELELTQFKKQKLVHGGGEVKEIPNKVVDKNHKHAESPKVKKEENEKSESPVKELSSNVILSPMDPAEKRRQRALNYSKYINREGPKHLGTKEIPKGKPGCLSGLVFVITGVLDSLERHEAANLIAEYGGKVTSNVSRNTSYLICGDEPGNTKIQKATSCGTPQIHEDDLLQMIATRSPQTYSPTAKVTMKQKCDQLEKHNDSPKCKKIKTEQSIVKARNQEMEGISNSSNLLKKTTENKVKNENLHDEKAVAVKKNVHKTEDSKKGEKLEFSKKEGHIKAVKSESNNSVLSEENGKVESSLWVDKYRPTKTKQIIGQQGDRSAMKKLIIWLSNWQQNHSGNKKLVKPSPWAKNDDGAYFKAALLSGSPGVGKTTMAHLVSKELGFDIVEFNASDTRSKKLLHEEITELLSNKSLFGYFHNESPQSSSKHILIMDEVDGMAGNEDRGGVQELIQLIKSSRIPIICMCNDRNHPKIRSLANYCFDLRVPKPRLEQIRGAMMSVCFKENLKIPADALNDIIIGSNYDVRQVLHHLSLWSVKDKQLSVENAKKEAEKAHKDMKIGPWDVVKKVFSAEDHKTMSIHDKSDLFFHDYSIAPLFVQENYLSVVPARAKGNVIKTLQCVAKSADAISLGDTVDKNIRSKSAWNLLPVEAMFSSVMPGEYMEGYIKSQINFPAWLGKNSRTGKFDRLLQELHVHTRLSTSGSKQALNMDYLTHIRDAIFQPLIVDGSSGVPASISVMQSYNLLREDLESIVELTQWPNQKDPMSDVDSKVKAALTRAYNKEGVLIPYSVTSVIKKHTKGGSGGPEWDEDGIEEVSEEEDDIKNDGMIKAKKPTAKKEEGSSHGRGRGKSDTGTSLKGSRGRGRGRGKK